MEFLDSNNFFEKIKNIKNDEKYEINLDIRDKKKITKILNKLLEFDKIKIHLYLSDLGLENIPESIFKLNIYKLFLTNNKLKNIPDDISKLVNLKNLNVSCNNIKYISPEISKLTKLKCLDLCYNSFEIFPEILYSLKSLTCLLMYEKKDLDINFKITKLKNLETFYVTPGREYFKNKKYYFLCDLQNLDDEDMQFGLDQNSATWDANNEWNIKKRLFYRLYFLICKSYNNILKKLFIYKILLNIIKYNENPNYDSESV